MRIVTWNLGYWLFRHHHADAWAYLRDEIKPDIALLQEICPAEMGSDESLIFTEVHRGWGTAIYCRGRSVTPVVMERYPSRVAAGLVEMPDGQSIGVASIHAPIIGGRVFPHLSLIFDDIESAFNGCPAIVGGDLNSARLAEQVWPKCGHGPFFERMAKGPWVDCHWRFHQEEIQTVFCPNHIHPFQDDHIFVSTNLEDKVTSCEVIHNEVTRRVSDHIPVVLDIVD